MCKPLTHAAQHDIQCVKWDRVPLCKLHNSTYATGIPWLYPVHTAPGLPDTSK
jgi:hypothetical protein